MISLTKRVYFKEIVFQILTSSEFRLDKSNINNKSTQSRVMISWGFSMCIGSLNSLVRTSISWTFAWSCMFSGRSSWHFWPLLKTRVLHMLFCFHPKRRNACGPLVSGSLGYSRHTSHTRKIRREWHITCRRRIRTSVTSHCWGWC